MPANKLALLRYRIINECLQNRHRKWTLEDLIDKVSDALYEYEGIESGISKRTIQLDIQTMRSDKLGYNAPIIVSERKYYSYSDKDYSITNANISKHDVEKLQEAVSVLNQFKGFTYFEDLSTMVSKLEDKILRQKKSKTYIDFEKNELLKGLQWIDPLLAAVKQQQVLEIQYKSFKSRQVQYYIIHPYLLKEYRNRWFILCTIATRPDLSLLALDRIEEITVHQTTRFENAPVDVHTYFDNVIGVTKSMNQAATKVILEFDASSAPYVLTKPLHPSQNILKEDKDLLIISIEVILNYELEREILGFGESVRVRGPHILRGRIHGRLNKALGAYG